MINRILRTIPKLCCIVFLLPLVSFAQWSSSDSALLQDISDNLTDYWEYWDLLEQYTMSIKNYNEAISKHTLSLTNLTEQIKEHTSEIQSIGERLEELFNDSEVPDSIDTIEHDVSDISGYASTIDSHVSDMLSEVGEIKSLLEDLEIPEFDMPDFSPIGSSMSNMVNCCNNVASNTSNLVDIEINLEDLQDSIDDLVEQVELVVGKLTDLESTLSTSLDDVATETTLSSFRTESHDDLVAISNTIAQFITAMYPATSSTGSLVTTSITAYQAELDSLALTASMNDNPGVFEQQLDSIDTETDLVNTNDIQDGYSDLIDDYVDDDDKTTELADTLTDELDSIEDKLYEGINFLDQIPTQDKLYLHPEFNAPFLKDQITTIEIDFTLDEETQDLLDDCWEAFGFILKCIAICYTSYLILNKVLSEWSSNPVGL